VPAIVVRTTDYTVISTSDRTLVLGILDTLLRWPFSIAADYRRVSRLFLRLLALIYLAAFASLALQIEALVGSRGLLPLTEHLQDAHQQMGAVAYVRLPTLFWLDAGDSALYSATVAGCVLAPMLLLGILPRLSLIGLFILYLSLFHAGQLFMNFQWDYLLLEAGFLAIFLPQGPNRLVVWLFHWLLFRLRFESGIAKLLSGDPAWSDFSALQYYFETQPLPHWGAWYAHQLPDWVLRSGVGLVLVAELLIPLLMFLPRRLRLLAAWVTLITQVLILLTSNHNFFNLLTMALCLFLFDDRAVAAAASAPARVVAGSPGRLYTAITGLGALLILSVSGSLLAEMVIRRSPPAVIADTIPYVRSFGIAHRYHVFPTIKTERIEVELQGSWDGIAWQSYTFRHKPQALDEMPRFIVPHQPRVDWMMWFVPLSLPMNRPWLERLAARLFENAPQVTALLKDNPFMQQPPRYIRAELFRYRFTTPEQRRATGLWWQREPLGPLLWLPWTNPAALPPASVRPRQPPQNVGSRHQTEGGGHGHHRADAAGATEVPGLAVGGPLQADAAIGAGKDHLLLRPDAGHVEPPLRIAAEAVVLSQVFAHPGEQRILGAAAQVGDADTRGIRLPARPAQSHQGDPVTAAMGDERRLDAMIVDAVHHMMVGTGHKTDQVFPGDEIVHQGDPAGRATGQRQSTFCSDKPEGLTAPCV